MLILWSGATAAAVAATESVSVLSLGFILHLGLKSRETGSTHLRRFSSEWAARSILVVAISLWALSHLLRLGLPTPLLCKLHVALSLGLLQPAFLAAILFLLHSSLSASSPRAARRALLSLLATSSPVFCLQLVVVFFMTGEVAGLLRLPAILWRSWSDAPAAAVVCTYPLLSTAVFGSFAAGYGVAFGVWACRAVSVVINKSIRLRIRGLAWAVAVSLPAQVALLALAGISRPGRPAHDAATLAAFLAPLACAVVGQGLLVIRPIADSLAVSHPCRSSGAGAAEEGCSGDRGV